MHTVVTFIVGFLVGVGLTWGFRGWIARTKAKAQGKIKL